MDSTVFYRCYGVPHRTRLHAAAAAPHIGQNSRIHPLQRVRSAAPLSVREPADKTPDVIRDRERDTSAAGVCDLASARSVVYFA